MLLQYQQYRNSSPTACTKGSGVALPWHWLLSRHRNGECIVFDCPNALKILFASLGLEFVDYPSALYGFNVLFILGVLTTIVNYLFIIVSRVFCWLTVLVYCWCFNTLFVLSALSIFQCNTCCWIFGWSK